MTGRSMGIDVGDRTLGIAVSDRLGIIAQPIETIRRKGLARDLDAVAHLARHHGVDNIVVGWPLRPDGTVGAQARKTARFIDALRDHLKLPIEPWDERMTTIIAESALIRGGVRRARRRQVIDKVAASLILQSWLDRRDADQKSAPDNDSSVT